MNEDKITILKTLVGSQAHGLADEFSDKDYRGVYVLPTSKLLSLNYKYEKNSFIEGHVDNTSYEIGHFLQLAMKCNPTILEVFKAPMVKHNEDGYKLRMLFDNIWNPELVLASFVGYGLNQRKKFLDKKDNRQNKYACAYLRTLIACEELLTTEDFNVEIPSKYLKMLKRYKAGNYQMGEIIDKAEELTAMCIEAYHFCKHKSNVEKVNSFLLEIRKKYWKV